MTSAEERGYDAAPRTCRNCEAALTGAYCAACGQRNVPPNPTLRDFADEWFNEILHWDGKLPATLKALMLKPGMLTVDFLAGRRVRWLSPLRIYLICSVAYFLTGPLVERATGFREEMVAEIKVTGDSAERILLSDSVAFVNDPEILANPLFQAIGVGRMWYIANNPSVWQDAYTKAIPKAMFVLLPFFALLTMVAWRASGMRYPAHLAFAFHVHAAFMTALILPTLIEPFGVLWLVMALQLGIFVYSTWYAIAAFKRALGGTTREVLWRSTVVGLLYLPPALLVTLVATVLAVRA
jgi:hypothetical protein